MRLHGLGADQPAEGRFDGEDNDFGIVDLRDDLYPELTQRMREVNGEILDARGHGASATRPR